MSKTVKCLVHVVGVLLPLTVFGQAAPAPVNHGEWTFVQDASELREVSVASSLALGTASMTVPRTSVSPSLAAVLAPGARQSRGVPWVELPDGRVLVAGGAPGSEGPSDRAEIFDAATNAWKSVGPMGEERSGHTLTLLSDGRVLVVGGEGPAGPSACMEIFDPFTDTFSVAGKLSTGRTEHAAVLLRDGRILVVGGWDGSQVLASAEIFDVAKGTTVPAGTMSTPRRGASATLLLKGTVLVAGGSNGKADLASAELFDPVVLGVASDAIGDGEGQDFTRPGRQRSEKTRVASAFSPVASPMAIPRHGHLAVRLPDNNTVLIVGGSSNGSATLSAERYISWTGKFEPAGVLTLPRVGAVGLALEEGWFLLAGGLSDPGPQISGEVYGFQTVKTDKDSYEVEETLRVAGAGWQPSENVSMVYEPDPKTHPEKPVSVQADPSGNLLDASYKPERADAGATIYIMAAGAQGAAATLANPALPDGVKLEQWETQPSANWTPESLGTSNSDYEEGETVPFRLDVGGLTGSYDLSICRDWDNGTHRGYLYLTPFNTSRPADPGGTISSTNGFVQGVNVSITSVTEVDGRGACSAGQRETKVSITTAGNSTQYVLWGGHLAADGDAGVGAGNGAGSYPGASLQMRLLSPDNTVSIQVSAIVELATITVYKVIDPGNQGSNRWCFNISGNPNNVPLPKCPTAQDTFVKFVSLPSGTYTITETDRSGYTFSSGDGTNCTFSGSTATCTVAVGTTPTDATATFHNTQATLTTTASAPPGAPVTVGQTIHDVAHLGGLSSMSGSITFKVYGPSDTPSCTDGNLKSSSSVSVIGASDYTSGDYTTEAAGKYYWIAQYYDQPNHLLVATACGDNSETSVVNKAKPTIATQQ
ncbi:MAG TPA: kelch repeat-containing protein, partial [Thermoanaerobaculaceae bacterium]|nr:kelch repeat-containing protein [Thermoanaerobaculaceae bacterium]